MMSFVAKPEVYRPHRSTARRLTARFGRAVRSSVGGLVTPQKPIQPIVPRVCSVRDNELPMLEALVKESNGLPGPIIEIGTLLGVATTQMALWKSPDKKITTVELFYWNPWNYTSAQHRDITTQVLHYLIQTKQVELVVSCKNAFYESYQGETPSLVFLDAIHDYAETAKDIAWARRVGAKIISGHDYSEEFPGVMKAVDEAGGPKQLEGTIWRL